MANTIWTIGHSSRSYEEFLELLKHYHIEAVLDVRRFPGSKKFPHFNREVLAKKLKESAIHYVGFPELGGRRKAQKNSKNDGWKNEAFRGYADYMETKDFTTGIHRLIQLSQQYRTAIMCSEALWWSCHRRLISDYLKVQGMNVIHILSIHKSQVHPIIEPAKVIYGKLIYGKNQLQMNQ